MPRLLRPLLLLAVAAAALPSAALAHPGHNHTGGGGGGLLPAGRVLASELDNPRGVAITRDGRIFVAEAGRGGTRACKPAAEGGGLVCLGETGGVTRIVGTRARRVVRGLPSFAGQGAGTEANGAHDVAFVGGRLHVLVGLGADPGTRRSLGRAGLRLGQLHAVRGGRAVPVADLAGFEARRNPDGGAPDSNPYGMYVVGRRVMVADAGANALLSVGANRSISTVATFPSRTVTVGEGTPMPAGEQVAMQSVPTAVTRGRDGAFYVSELTGLPFPKGASQVYRVVPGRAPTVFARGFTNVVDIARAPQGGIYVLELAAEGLFGGPPAGRLVHVDPDGTQHEVVAGLPAPGGMAVDRNGRVIVTLNSTQPGAGVVMRLAASHAGSGHDDGGHDHGGGHDDGGHDHGGGGHADHPAIGLPFGHMPDLDAASAANVRRARALWQGTRREGARARYATQAAAARAGYRRTSSRRTLPRPTVFHMRDEQLDRDGRQLDPRRPESLVFYLPPSGAPVLVAFMYRAETLRPHTLGGLLGYHRHGTHAAAMPMTHVWLTGELRSALANCLPVAQLEQALPRFRYAGSQLVSGPESFPCADHGEAPAHEH